MVYLAQFRITVRFKNCQNLCTNCLKIEWSRNVLFAASRGLRRKRKAAFVASREYVTMQGLNGLKIHCYMLFFG